MRTRAVTAGTKGAIAACFGEEVGGLAGPEGVGTAEPEGVGTAEAIACLGAAGGGESIEGGY